MGTWGGYKPDAASLLRKREQQYEDLAKQMFEDMLQVAKEYGSGHENSLDEVAGQIRCEYAYKMGELSGQHEALVTQLEEAFREE